MIDFTKIGIIGEGKMGSSIFHYLLGFSYELVWVVSQKAEIEKVSKQFIKRINRSLEAGIIDQQQFERLRQTKISHELSELNDCELIIEAIPEDAELKKALFLQLDSLLMPGAIFTSNSSSINPSQIAPEGDRSGNFVGLHFFYPVALKDIVEVTVSENTTQQTLSRIDLFLHEIQRQYIKLDEENSFILNKIFLDFQNEAFLIVHSGNCSYKQMDLIVRENFFPHGVFDFCDSVGIDTMYNAILNYTINYPDKSNYSLLLSKLSDLISHGRLGMKSQGGFYQYPACELDDETSANDSEILERLNHSWFSAVTRFTKMANIPIETVNRAIKEYFGISEGPFG
ncbi:MAG: 3-hydroxyacyl-CoA dehydrogenase family protein [Bacteroidales bacterium]